MGLCSLGKMCCKSDISTNRPTEIISKTQRQRTSRSHKPDNDVIEISSKELSTHVALGQLNLNILKKENEMTIPKVVGGRFEKKKYLASGTFGDVFLAVDTKTKQSVVIKVSKRFGKLLFSESKVYQKLKGAIGFCSLIWYGEETDRANGGKFTFLVLEHVGVTLDRIFKKCNGTFTIFTVLKLGIEILSRIQNFHELTGLIHRDLKPGNFAYNSNKKVIYLIDFGLAKEYSKSNKQKTCEKGIGTMEFCSINSGLGFEQSFRDDLESAGYVLIYFLLGSLPWSGIKQQAREERLRLATNMKIKTKIKKLPIPNVFSEYMDYVTNLDFNKKPDYEFLRQKFKQNLIKMNIITDLKYDWEKYLGVDSNK